MKISSMIFISIIAFLCSGTVKHTNKSIKDCSGLNEKAVLRSLDEYQFNYNDGADARKFRKVDILHYDLSFDLHPDKKMFYASAEIKGIVKDKESETIDLNFYDNYKIGSVTLDGYNTEYINKGKNFSVKLKKPIIDTFLLKIDYSGTPEKAGFVGFDFGENKGTSLVYNLSEPNYASSWFPCNDSPSDKALLDMRIENDSSQVSVSNGILVDVIDHDARRTYHWKTVYPISTYLIAIYSSNYSHFSDSYISLNKQDTMSIDYYVLPTDLENAKLDFKQHPDMIRFFSETFGEYPFIKEKYGIAEFFWELGAMEHQTITGLASNMIGGKGYFLDVLVHELAHHWWGDAVGPKYWKDIWLNEGFATYSEALFYEFRSGKSALQSTMLNKKQSNFRGSLENPGNFLFTSTVYDKGAWVLHMLRWELGDRTFFEILRKYFEKYKYSNASTVDFENVCESVSNKDLTKFFDQWIKAVGEIELKYNWNVEEGSSGNFSTNISLHQDQKEYDEYHFPLEIALKFENDKSEIHKVEFSKKSIEVSFKSSSEPVDVILDPNNWLLMYAEKE